MTDFPQQAATEEDVAAWYVAAKQLTELKAKEMALRLKVFRGFFPAPEEGTNTHMLSTQHQLKCKYPIIRDVDVAAFDAMRTRQESDIPGVLSPSPLEVLGLNADKLVRWKPELVLSEYRTLTEEQQAFFNGCLIIRAGSPALEITDPPKKRGKAGGTAPAPGAAA